MGERKERKREREVEIDNNNVKVARFSLVPASRAAGGGLGSWFPEASSSRFQRQKNLARNRIPMAHLAPSAIFSPSVARQQLAAAKDWNYVDNWLSTKFNGKTPPPFERNNDSLKALLALAALNESADEESELLASLEAKTLQDIEAKGGQDASAHVLASIEEAMTREGQVSLEALSNLSIVLGQTLPNTEKLGQAIIDLQLTSNDLEQTSGRITILETHLNTELESINTLIRDLQSESYNPPSDVTKQTMDYQRKIKTLTSKLPELKDRVSSSISNSGVKVTVQDVKAEEDKFKELLATVKSSEMEVKSFHNLPQDTDLARLELETLRAELRDLTLRRDSMFEGLVERASPKKFRS